MKKKTIYLIPAITAGMMLCACGSSDVPQGVTVSTSAETEASSEAQSVSEEPVSTTDAGNTDAGSGDLKAAVDLKAGAGPGEEKPDEPGSGNNSHIRSAGYLGAYETQAEGNEFSIYLYSNPSTGYDWETKIFDACEIDFSDREFVRDDTQGEADGAGGDTKIHGRLLSDEDVEFTLVYERPWEPDDPSMIYNVKINQKDGEISNIQLKEVDIEEIKEEAGEETGGEEDSETAVAGQEPLAINLSNISLGLYNSCKEEAGDFMYSPYSLKEAFGILYPASEGDSKSQMEEAFGFANGGYGKIKKSDSEMVFTDGKGVKAANKAYINKNGVPDGSLNVDVLGTENADIIDFDSQTYEFINQWISDNTEGKIKDLLSSDSVNAETKSVLVNCLYFMMNWNAEEQYIDWKSQENYIPSFGNTTSVFNVKEDGGIDILRLPYEPVDYNNDTEHKYSMYVICDSEGSEGAHVDEYMGGMTDEKLNSLLAFDNYEGLNGYDEADYNVPCFEMKNMFRLDNPLKKEGLTAPFNPDTKDFMKFGPVHVDEVIQGTYIKCDEKGTEAAAATAITMKTTSIAEPMETKVKHVVADDTFAFAIKDETSGEILFIGRVDNPSYTRPE